MLFRSYHALWDYAQLYKLGTEVKASSDLVDIKTAAAVSEDGKTAAILLCYYKDHRSMDGSGCDEETVKVRIDWSGFASGDGVTAEYRFVDAMDDGNEVRVEETFFGDTGAHVFTLPLYTSILVTLKK